MLKHPDSEDSSVIHASSQEVYKRDALAQESTAPAPPGLWVSLPIPLGPGGSEWRVTFVPVCGQPLQLHAHEAAPTQTRAHACARSATAHLQRCAGRRCCYPEHNLVWVGGKKKNGLRSLRKHTQTHAASSRGRAGAGDYGGTCHFSGIDGKDSSCS